ncbi:hypothetical protein GQ53DRAFT_747862 [Thozetella sp. PMI_491]|nr:hypothetical protein GQ53DRAFT_747862 [Thozetella sp. PMI_491]
MAGTIRPWTCSEDKKQANVRAFPLPSFLSFFPSLGTVAFPLRSAFPFFLVWCGQASPVNRGNRDRSNHTNHTYPSLFPAV